MHVLKSVNAANEPAELVARTAEAATSERPSEQIMDVVKDIQRVNVDEEVALTTALDEQGQFLETTDVMKSFEDIPTLELECERVYRWRN